jgi:hypothetical protein
MMEVMGEISEYAASALRERLRHVYWVGGGSGAGKSTIARRLAAQHGLGLYATDDVMPDHGSRINFTESPFLSKFVSMDMDERWVNRSPQTMLETFHWFQGEGFGLIVDDLLRLPAQARPCVICLNVTGCSPNASSGKRSHSDCASSRSTPR